ncbi:enoyl-CoA hydratase/isomerase family protein [Comamonas flocculans]|uniref:Enoyl-CoA hydratase/isomerase family protein n=1 Tax=Comamonas flocculans TaxID=2597701 RepID=A0A5B8RR64_9BURK|nr:enoyl-CoA hydratase/isomerase family protein [Comamonas flocculans]QEA12130.1 enoyl-CoA hydratase/isomerase family protein [Comamonas flocculans]
MAGEIVLEAADALGIVRVTLRHPGRLNAMARAMWRELRTVFEGIQADAGARCVLVQGEGEAFCAGGDISEYPAFRFDAQKLRDFHEIEVWGGLSAMLECEVPIVAAIRGACMGAGVEIASCCDIRLAEEGARFGAPIARLGFPMAPREALLVARSVGDALARQMLLAAATFDARALQASGFLAEVLAPPELQDRAEKLARHIAALSPQAARLNKRVLRSLFERNTAQTLDGQAPTAMVSGLEDPYAYADSREHHEGIEAFLAKRKPRFTDDAH